LSSTYYQKASIIAPTEIVSSVKNCWNLFRDWKYKRTTKVTCRRWWL